MSLLRTALASASFLVLSACGVPAEVSAPDGAAGASPFVELHAEPSRHPRGTPPPARWLAAGEEGAVLVLADAAGATLATAAMPDGFVLRDVAVDAPHHRALIFASDLEDGYGEVLAVAVEPSALGSPEHVAWIDGDARLGVTGDAIVAFEQSYGEAWKRIDPAGAALPRWPAPPPLSLGFLEDGSIDALIDDGAGGLALVRVDDDVSAWPPAHVGVGASLETPALARLVEGEGAATWIFDGAGAALGVRAATAGSASVPLGLDPGAGGLVDATSFGCGARVALFLDAGSLVTLRLDASGLPHEVAVLPLPGAPPADASSLHVLARIAPTRLLVATTSGVHAVDVIGAAPALDPTFDGASFRAPVVAWR